MGTLIAINENTYNGYDFSDNKFGKMYTED